MAMSATLVLAATSDSVNSDTPNNSTQRFKDELTFAPREDHAYISANPPPRKRKSAGNHGMSTHTPLARGRFNQSRLITAQN